MAIPSSPVVELSIKLLDKSKSKTKQVKTSLQNCVWKLGQDAGMYELTTSSLSNCGYVFAFGGKKWKSNYYPNLTLAEAGVSKSGESVEFTGDFEAFNPTVPATPAAPIPIELKVTLQEVSRSMTRIWRTTPDKCVWKFGEEVGMTTLATSLSNGGYIFRFGGKQWSSSRHPNLKLFETGLSNGAAVEFQVDLEPSGAAGPMAESMELSVMLVDKWNSSTVTCRAFPDQCVWRFGEDAGMRKLTTGPLSKYGYVFRYGDGEWKSNQYPNLTLAETGVLSGGVVEFRGDFEAFEPAKEASPLVGLHVTLLDRSKSSTTTGKTRLDKCVWVFGNEVGMTKLTTSTLSNSGYLFRFGGKKWRSNQHPNLTLAEAGVCKEGDMVEFLGDFDPVGTC